MIPLDAVIWFVGGGLWFMNAIHQNHHAWFRVVSAVMVIVSMAVGVACCMAL